MSSRRLIIIERNTQIYIVKANHEILTFWVEHMIGEMELIPTDIIIITIKAWENSFAEVEPNKKSIEERGWFPYNQSLLIYKQLRDTTTMKDIKTEKRTLVPSTLAE